MERAITALSGLTVAKTTATLASHQRGFATEKICQELLHLMTSLESWEPAASIVKSQKLLRVGSCLAQGQAVSQ